MPEAWDAVVQVLLDIKIGCKLNKMPFERIFISFGYLQSQAGRHGLKPDDCHAHINIELTKEVIEACKE